VNGEICSYFHEEKQKYFWKSLIHHHHHLPNWYIFKYIKIENKCHLNSIWMITSTVPGFLSSTHTTIRHLCPTRTTPVPLIDESCFGIKGILSPPSPSPLLFIPPQFQQRPRQKQPLIITTTPTPKLSVHPRPSSKSAI